MRIEIFVNDAFHDHQNLKMYVYVKKKNFLMQIALEKKKHFDNYFIFINSKALK